MKSFLRFVNFESFLSAELSENKSNMQLNDYINTFFDSSLSWSDIKWLQRYFKMNRQ